MVWIGSPTGMLMREINITRMEDWLLPLLRNVEILALTKASIAFALWQIWKA